MEELKHSQKLPEKAASSSEVAVAFLVSYLKSANEQICDSQL
jgi:hypothetical protein